MTKEMFYENLGLVYELTKNQAAKMNDLYKLIDDESSNKEGFEFLQRLSNICEIPLTKQHKIALLARVVNLREDSLIQTFENLGIGEEKIKERLSLVYEEVASFYIQKHQELINEIEEKGLLSPFYLTLIKGVHAVGIKLTLWQPFWTKYIINTINPQLLSEFKSDEGVMKFIYDNDLFDKNSDGSLSDRSYSVIEKDSSGYKNSAYATYFSSEVEGVCIELDRLVENLNKEEEDIFNAKDAYIEYFKAISAAFRQKDTTKLISSWQDVDRAWMRVKTPIQVGHPLEYYEDHYKKAVALEWDIRLSNPKDTTKDHTQKNIVTMYEKLFSKINGFLDSTYDKSVKNVFKTDLFIGRPFIYYAAQFNGLFSAQVVPNDEIVSHEEGKKIFAYADNVLDSIRAKPFMKISSQVFGNKFLKEEREVVFKKPALWYKIYEVTTIGHEFGHILWMDEDTEAIMNRSGAFKNIEEFKATTGGLMAFFENMDEKLLPYIINDTIKRSIGLIAWMKTSEVEPYYCEALIHLSGLFESGVLSFGERLEIDRSDENIKRLISWYYDTYTKLASHYLEKRDAKEFLEKFAKKENGSYMPTDKAIKRFVEYYWELHKEIGRDVDTTDSKENYL